MKKPTKPPRLSINKLGEYMTARAGRQNKILHDAKYPQDYIVAYYKDAAEAIAKCIVDGLEDLRPLDAAIRNLEQRIPKNTGEQRRFAGNIDAIETFISIMDRIDLKGVVPRLGSHQASTLRMNGVEISVRPEVTLHGEKRSGEKIVGGMKLHFPKSFPLNTEAAEYISTGVQLYANDHLFTEGAASHKHCYVVDMASAQVYEGIQSIKQRTKDMGDTTLQIASIWPNI
jgi:hypothetical protein